MCVLVVLQVTACVAPLPACVHHRDWRPGGPGLRGGHVSSD
jgi:hypothetical protein